MEKYRAFINNIMQRYNKWNVESEGDLWYFDKTFTLEEQVIIHLYERSKDWEQAKYDADEKIDELKEKIANLKQAKFDDEVVKNNQIAELNEKIKLKDARMQKELDYKVKKANQITKLEEEISNKKMQIDKLWEHIDCLENNPFRRIYNWVTGIVKYRVKLVKIGDNK